jgi:catechol 2,3-dioxygenase-like lactoylglutathione lyase family enzyme
MRIDHVVLATRDIEATARRLLQEHGLGAVPGGDHPDWGTGNSIVPAGDAYVELMGVRDLQKASESWLGRWLLSVTEAGDKLGAVAVAVPDLDEVCGRLGVTATPGRRVRPDGTTLSWRLAGIENAIAEGLPFFISWDDATGGSESPAEGMPAVGISRVELGGDVDRVREWLGGTVPGLELVGGVPGCRSVTLETADGSVVLRS